MKISILIVCFVLLKTLINNDSVVVFNDAPKVITCQTLNLQGKVKSFTESFSFVIIEDDSAFVPDSLSSIIESVSIQYFDENGIWIKTYSEKNGELYYKTEVKFDNDSNYLGFIVTDTINNVTFESKLIEFTNDRIVEENFSEYGKISVLSRYYSNGLLIKTIYESLLGNKNIKTNEYVYDENMRLKAIIINNSSPDLYNSMQLVKYLEFDEKGNWTKRLSYTNGLNSGQLTVRSFEYYD